jgi:hypothetical protein
MRRGRWPDCNALVAGTGKQSDAGEDSGGSDQVPGPVVKVQVNAVAYLIQPDDLVLDGAVVEMKAACAEQQTGPPEPWPPRAPPVQVGQQEQPADRGKPAERMEQRVGDQPAAVVDLSSKWCQCGNWWKTLSSTKAANPSPESNPERPFSPAVADPLAAADRDVHPDTLRIL